MLSRRELMQRGATLAGGALALGKVPSALADGHGPHVAGMNIVMFITDQERAIQHFPRGWSRRHLPGFTRLQRHGLTFENAFCNACMCSPTRATMLTGYFAAQHGVKYTLEENMSDCDFPQVELPQKVPSRRVQRLVAEGRNRAPGHDPREPRDEAERSAAVPTHFSTSGQAR